MTMPSYYGPSDDDHHKLWRYVGRKVTALEETAPTGWAPIVEVYLANHPAPIVVNFAETEQGFPYALLHSVPDSAKTTEPATTDQYVFTHRSVVTHVVVRFVRADPGGLGFGTRERLEDLGDDAGSK